MHILEVFRNGLRALPGGLDLSIAIFYARLLGAKSFELANPIRS